MYQVGGNLYRGQHLQIRLLGFFHQVQVTQAAKEKLSNYY